MMDLYLAIAIFICFIMLMICVGLLYLRVRLMEKSWEALEDPAEWDAMVRRIDEARKAVPTRPRPALLDLEPDEPPPDYGGPGWRRRP